MPARASLHALLLALFLFVSACAKDQLALDAITELDALTDEIVTIISEADDKRAGVAEAQAKLEARQAELGSKMQKVMALRGFQISEETTAKVKLSLTENTLKMVTLEMDLFVAAATDSELQAAFERLARDYKLLVDGE
jgi:hypothetical protein